MSLTSRGPAMGQHDSRQQLLPSTCSQAPKTVTVMLAGRDDAADVADSDALVQQCVEQRSLCNQYTL